MRPRSACATRRAGPIAQGFGPLTGAALVSRQAWVDRLRNDRADAALRMNSYDNELQRRRVELTAGQPGA